MKILPYLASLPERLVRATAAVLGGLLRELAELSLPPSIRRSRLYQATVERLLRIAVEWVGDVRGVYMAEKMPVQELAVRKAAGNVFELASVLAVGFSPLWLLAAVSDLTGGAKIYLQTLQTELKRVGTLPPATDVSSFDALLTALEGASGVLADTVDVPPLNVADIRATWQALRVRVAELPDAGRLSAVFADLQAAAQREGRSLLDVSAIVGLGAVRAGIQMGDTYLFQYYREALQSIAQEGLAAYTRRVSRPYLQRAGGHLDPAAPTWTQRLLRRLGGSA